MNFKTILAMRAGLVLALSCLANHAVAATPLDDRIGSWMTEPGVLPPSYAVTAPIESNVNSAA